MTSAPEAPGTAGGVHRHIAAADDDDLLPPADRSVVLVLIGLHQVDTGEVLIGGDDAAELLPVDAHKPGQAGTGADEHRLKALGHQLIDALGTADDRVGEDAHAEALKAFDLFVDDVLGQTETPECRS